MCLALQDIFSVIVPLNHMNLINQFSHHYRLLAKDELVATLKKCVDILKSGKTKKMRSALQQLEDYVVKFEQLDSRFLHIVATL